MNFIMCFVPPLPFEYRSIFDPQEKAIDCQVMKGSNPFELPKCIEKYKPLFSDKLFEWYLENEETLEKEIPIYASENYTLIDAIWGSDCCSYIANAIVKSGDSFTEEEFLTLIKNLLSDNGCSSRGKRFNYLLAKELCLAYQDSAKALFSSKGLFSSFFEEAVREDEFKKTSVFLVSSDTLNTRNINSTPTKDKSLMQSLKKLFFEGNTMSWVEKHLPLYLSYESLEQDYSRYIDLSDVYSVFEENKLYLISTMHILSHLLPEKFFLAMAHSVQIEDEHAMEIFFDYLEWHLIDLRQSEKSKEIQIEEFKKFIQSINSYPEKIRALVLPQIKEYLLDGMEDFLIYM